MAIGAFRNYVCKCGSGKKFKKCCLLKYSGWEETRTGYVQKSELVNLRKKIDAPIYGGG